MTTIDVENLSLLDRFKYIPLSMNSENIGNLLLGKWNHYCSENNYTGPNLLGTIFEFSNDYINYLDSADRQRFCYWSIHEFFEDGYKKVHPFMKTIQIRFPKSNFDYINPVIIYIDEKIMLLGAQGNFKGKYNYKLTDICIRDEALDLFKTNDDILLYFSKIENHWENEKFKTKYKIKEEIENYESYFTIASIVLLIISIIILFILYDSILVRFCGVFGLFILIPTLIHPFYRLMENIVIKNYKKKNPDNRFAQIMTRKLFYKIG